MDSVVVSTSTWHAVARVTIHVNKRITLMSVPSQFEDVKEPLRMTSTLAMTTPSVSIERSAWRKCSEKRLTNSIRS